MERSLLILLSALTGFSGCLTVDGGNVQALEHTLVTERSPDFDEDRSGHLDGEPTDLLPLDDAILACSDDGLSLSELDDDGAVGKERLETEASRSSEHAVACTDRLPCGLDGYDRGDDEGETEEQGKRSAHERDSSPGGRESCCGNSWRTFLSAYVPTGT